MLINDRVYKDSIKEEGYKLTPQRRAVLEKIIENKGKHLTTEEVFEIVKTNYPEIGLATVYRTLQLFEEIGIASILNLDDGIIRYELSDSSDEHQHHQLVCTKCGSLYEVEMDLLEDLEKNISDKYNFRILNHSLKFYGICKKCKNDS